jgi:mono/diheme cytochrome c family protein
MRQHISRGPYFVVTVLMVLSGLTVGNVPLAAQFSDGTAAADTAYFSAYHVVPRDTVTQVVYQGWKQFALHCARCHGDYGVGTSFAPALIESVKATGGTPTFESFVQTVCAGRMDKGMPAWCTLGLEMDNIQALHAYLVERASGALGIGRPAVLAR